MSIIAEQKVHKFKDCYDFAENGKNEPFWQEIYKKAFPDLILCERTKQAYTNGQKLGEDRILHLDNGKHYSIDEKVRKQERDDICLEYISNDKYNTPGWMEKDLRIDFLAYGFLDIKTAYLFIWPALKRAWHFFRDKWIEKYFKVVAANETYNTISVAVPIEEVYKAQTLAMIIMLGDPKLNPHIEMIQRLLKENLTQGDLF